MSPAPRRSRHSLTRWIVSAGLVLLTLLVYCCCLDHSFIGFDDEHYATENAHVQQGLTADSVRWAFTTFACANWHPLTWLSLQLDATLFGGQNAGGFHLTNVLLHTASTLVLFMILTSMTGSIWRSAMVSALFALHPMHVEPVAWVAERKGVLSTLFWMLTLDAYLAFVHRPGVGRYLLVVLALGLGLMAKPMLVTLPCVLLLLDYWPLGRFGRVPLRQLFLEKVPLVVLALVWCVLAIVAQHQGGALPSLKTIPLEARISNALVTYVIYLGQMFWPLDLAVFYPHPGFAVPQLHALGAGLLLLLITALVLGPGRRWPYLAVGWLWYFVTLVPVIGLVQVSMHARADRYTYIPLIGVFLFIVWGVSDLARAWRLPRVFVAAIGTVVVCACAALTWIQLGYWRNDLSLWNHAVAVTGETALAHVNLGVYQYGRGDLEAAENEFEQAAALDPSFAQAHFNRGKVLQDLGRLEDASAEYGKTLDINPRAYQAHYNLGLVLRDLGRRDEAIQEYRQALELEPDWPEAHINLGLALLEASRYAEALASLKRGHALGVRNPHWTYPSAQWVQQAERLVGQERERR
jgi:Flp pilus assembly protein TadD